MRVYIHIYIWKRKEGRRDRADGLDEKFIYTESVFLDDSIFGGGENARGTARCRRRKISPVSVDPLTLNQRVLVTRIQSRML